ncbi:hypothetical protein ACI2LJ_36035 [Streptomyces sp. NPDC088090]|uniref:hypothetical protein n=1 Tax=Streptomyces sp. NPDC088090 TaxID=3365822 RepID=UPI00384F51AB
MTTPNTIPHAMTSNASALPAIGDEDTATAIEHAEATVEETIGTWPACGCPHHRGAA